MPETIDHAQAVPNAARLAHLEKKAESTEFTPLQKVTRPALTTREAAHYLNRAEQTLRVWAAFENGPLRPLRVHGRLAWPTAAIKTLMGLAP